MLKICANKCKRKHVLIPNVALFLCDSEKYCIYFAQPSGCQCLCLRSFFTTLFWMCSGTLQVVLCIWGLSFHNATVAGGREVRLVEVQSENHRGKSDLQSAKQGHSSNFFRVKTSLQHVKYCRLTTGILLESATAHCHRSTNPSSWLNVLQYPD